MMGGYPSAAATCTGLCSGIEAGANLRFGYRLSHRGVHWVLSRTLNRMIPPSLALHPRLHLCGFRVSLISDRLLAFVEFWAWNLEMKTASACSSRGAKTRLLTSTKAGAGGIPLSAQDLFRPGGCRVWVGSGSRPLVWDLKCPSASGRPAICRVYRSGSRLLALELSSGGFGVLALDSPEHSV